MKKFLRSVQTLFPYLHDFRYRINALRIKVTRTPVEDDFKAIKAFQPEPDQDFVDIGANRGETILSMQLFNRQRNRIVAFEPNPLLFEKFKKRGFLSKDKLQIHNYGLSRENGELTLYVPFYRRWMFDGLSSFHYEEAKNWLTNRMWRFDPKKMTIRQITCQVRRLDDFKLKPYFVKIDVQGHELAVLEGGRETLAEYKPILLIEGMNDEIANFLKPLGYQFYTFDNGGFKEGYGKLNTFCMTRERFESLKGSVAA